jgi:nitroimidazol reductase NimA-like FMN-containing flavoprotein (pyridoxamine 5'-phosphate oxidase superfamily)
MDGKTKSFILDQLARHENLTLATVRADGYPQATTVGYVNDGLTIYVGTGPDSQKIENIRGCDKVSLTVDRDEPDWSRIQGLSMGGRAAIVEDGGEITRIQSLMLAKFPQLKAMPAIEPGSIAFIRITPEVISVLDYTKGFGHTELVRV